MTIEGPVILSRQLSFAARCGGKPLVDATRYWLTLPTATVGPDAMHAVAYYYNLRRPLKFASPNLHFRLFSLHHGFAKSFLLRGLYS